MIMLFLRVELTFSRIIWSLPARHGRALTLYTLSLRKDLPEWGKGADIDMGLLQARGRTLSKQKQHLLYDDVSGLLGDAESAVVLFDDKVVRMHPPPANTLVDDLERELDAQMDEVAGSIASAANNPAQLGLPCCALSSCRKILTCEYVRQLTQSPGNSIAGSQVRCRNVARRILKGVTGPVVGDLSRHAACDL